MFPPQETKKEEQYRLKNKHRKGIIMCGNQLNGKQKTTDKNQWTKKKSFWKFNVPEKPPARLEVGRERQRQEGVGACQYQEWNLLITEISDTKNIK